jgi:hypothetical protein
MNRPWKVFAAFAGVFLVAYYLPLADPKVIGAVVFGIAIGLGDSVVRYAAGDTFEISKARIAAIPDVDTWVVRVHHGRWYVATVMGVLVALMTWRWYDGEEIREWMDNTWSFAKLLVPLLFGGVFIVGFLGALIPEKQVAGVP